MKLLIIYTKPLWLIIYNKEDSWKRTVQENNIFQLWFLNCSYDFTGDLPTFCLPPWPQTMICSLQLNLQTFRNWNVFLGGNVTALFLKLCILKIKISESFLKFTEVLTKMTTELYFKTTEELTLKIKLCILSPLTVYQVYKSETLDHTECDWDNNFTIHHSLTATKEMHSFKQKTSLGDLYRIVPFQALKSQDFRGL